MSDEQTVTCVVWCGFAIIGEITEQSNYRSTWRHERAYEPLSKEQTMPPIQGYRLNKQVVKQQRPFGLAVIGLWINWGFWDLIRWAWWANLLLTLIAIGGLVTALLWIQPIGAMLAK